MERNFCLTFLLAVISVFNSFSQLYMGAEAGFSHGYTRIGSKTERELSDFGFKPGFSAGLGVHYDISDHFAISSGALFTIEGKDQTQNELKYKNKASYRYLDFPLNLRVLLPAGNGNFYLSVGPSMNLFLGGNGTITPQVGSPLTFEELSYNFEEGPVDGNRSTFNPTDMNKVGWSMNFGFGYFYRLEQGYLIGFEAQYRQGHSNIGRYDEIFVDPYGEFINVKHDIESSPQSLYFGVSLLKQVKFFKISRKSHSRRSKGPNKR
ncbi:porin family protein [Marinigracilibium pacificum]|uniref:PorT family protein n=1 Tax=Marinigracilibium pacificum TaxID=2729599 RepID=A0A848J491_9BACT|nr:porin family protein [Marinigracilibium pacificum]NMM49294.1 PorT family protein [Marinigracilibium pacificum]